MTKDLTQANDSGPKPKNPYWLFSSMPGYLIAEREIASGIDVAVTLGATQAAIDFMRPILIKHSRFGSDESATQEVVLSQIEQHFRDAAKSKPLVAAATKDLTALELLQNAVRAQTAYWAAMEALELRLADDEPLSDYLKEKLNYAVEGFAMEIEDSGQIEEGHLKQILSKLNLNAPRPR